MSAMVSPSTGRLYGVRLVACELEVRRSTYYGRRRRAETFTVAARRGPRTALNDHQLLEAIRSVLADSPFTGEGHRKVWAALKANGTPASKRRVLRLMRESQLLAPTRARRVLGPYPHDGKIVTDRPNEMWGTDATGAFTAKEGWATVFIAIDHYTAECVGIHAAKTGTRFEALEPIRQGVKARFETYGADAGHGLRLRHDHGSQYMSDVFQNELRFLGISSSPAFVRAPEGNGCAERFIRTLKEQLLWIRHFETVEELRLALHEWAALYNTRWRIERLGHVSPAEARKAFIATPMAA